MVLTSMKTVLCFSHNQNPREASSRSRIFIYSLVNVSVSGFVRDLLAKGNRIQT